MPNKKPHPGHHTSYLWPVLCKALPSGPGRLLDIGCGRGATSGMLASMGWEVVGLDPFEKGIDIARKSFPECEFHLASVYDDLSHLGTFDVVISMEVVEHLTNPRLWGQRIRHALATNGIAIVSTPYHGWLKNVAVAASGQWDRHHAPFDDGGHIKFWSRDTLTRLLTESGLSVLSFAGAGRLPFLWKSMVFTAERTANS